MAKKSKRGTPEWLDKTFERMHLDRPEMIEFWRGFWKHEGKRAQEHYADQFALKFEAVKEKTPHERLQAKYKNREEAHIAAATIKGGRVIRRDAKGRFSTRGRSWTVVKFKTGGRKHGKTRRR